MRLLEQRWDDERGKLKVLRAQIEAGVDALERGDFVDLEDAELDDAFQDRRDHLSHVQIADLGFDSQNYICGRRFIRQGLRHWEIQGTPSSDAKHGIPSSRQPGGSDAFATPGRNAGTTLYPPRPVPVRSSRITANIRWKK